MLNLQTFERQISSKIIERGLNYHRRGAVVELQQVDENTWVATVQGNTNYTVQISLSGESVQNLRCTCPYDWGPVCKHEVAVLYAIHEFQTGYSQNQVREPNAPPRKQLFSRTLEKISERDLKAFIREYAGFHPEFISEFLARFPELSGFEGREKYVQMIRTAIRSGQDQHGFVSYNQSFRVMRPISELITRAEEMLERKEYLKAYHIATAVTEEVTDLLPSMDDSSGEAGQTIEYAFEVLDEIASVDGESELQQRLFDYCLQEVSKEKYMDFSFDTRFLYLLVDLAENADREQQLWNTLDTLQKRAKQRDASFKGNWNQERLLDVKIAFLQQRDKPEQAERLIRENLHIPRFREQMITQALEQENYQEARSLVEDGLAQENEQPGFSNTYRWEKWKLKTAEKEKSPEHIRRHARNLFLQQPGHFQYYRKLKDTYSPEEWPEQVERLIQDIKANIRSRPQRILAHIYAEEGHWDRLLEVLQNASNLGLVERYLDDLRDRYPDEILELYKTGIRTAAKPAKGRGHYRYLVSLLKRLQQLEGGREAARSLVQEFRDRYSRRPAMMDELDKLSL